MLWKKVDLKRTWYIPLKPPSVIFLIRNKESTRSCGPYSFNVITNIGNIFLSLLKKHFPRKNKVYKIFNRNNVKISYSCMSNILSIIAGHNKLLVDPKITKYVCTCWVENTYPLHNQCQSPNFIDQV